MFIDVVHHTILVIIVIHALFGWGRLVMNRYSGKHPWGITLCVGMAVFQVLGGLLVVLGWMGRVQIFILLLVGCGVIVVKGYQFYREQFAGKPSASMSSLLQNKTAVLLWLLVVAYAVHLVHAFGDYHYLNYHDDFEKYFKYPVQLLEAGHLRTGLYDAMGMETLGGQSFFQSVFLALGGVSFISAFDSAFCLIVLLLVIVSMPGVSKILKAALLLMTAAFDPLMLNTSSIYSGAIAMVLIYYGIIHYFRRESSGSCNDGIWLFALGISLAVPLKSSLAIVIPIYAICWCAVAIREFGVKKATADLFKLVGLSVALTLPWFFVHFPKYVSLVANILNPQKPSLFDPIETPMISEYFLLFDFGDFVYGHHCNIGQFTLVILVLCLALLVLLYFVGSGRIKMNPGVGVVMIAVLAIYGWQMIFFSSSMGQPHVIRYMIPDFAALFVPIAIAAKEVKFSSNLSSSMKITWARVFLVSVLFISGLFMPSLVERVKRSYQGLPLISLPSFNDSNYMDFCDWMFGENQRAYLLQLQQLIPEGSTMLVWCVGGFHLDYSRNRIYGAEPAGMIAPWAELPSSQDMEAGLGLLKQQGIDYVLWQYGGLGVRDRNAKLDEFYPLDQKFLIADRTFSGFLEDLSGHPATDLIYSDRKFRLIKISADLEL